MFDRDFWQFIGFTLLGLFIIWAIFMFVTWNPLWFIATWFGRLMAVIGTVMIIGAAHEAVYK